MEPPVNIRRTVRIVATFVLTMGVGAAATAAGGATSPATSTASVAPAWYVPPVRHVFVVNLENKSYDVTFGANSPAKYLNKSLLPKGQLLDNYYGVAHNSLPNYIAQISGQGPNPQTQGDCQVFSDFRQAATAAPGQAVGTGCVYPAGVPTVANQLAGRGFTWKGYMEDMATATTQPTCRHPAIGSVDNTQTARVGDQYAARHNPFVYFHSIIDTPACATRVVDLSRLPGDLQKVSTTPNLSYITPNLCDDGHDAPCVDGRPGGLMSADAWLKLWIPRLLASPAFRQDGLLIVTFDEAELTGANADSSSCCGEGPGPNSPLPGITGLGGGRVGAIAVSRWTRPGRVNATAYNHYALLRSIEDLFGVGHLGYASAAGVRSFGHDVFDAT
jgi:phosphatidylinositol-3-phosphatase